MVREVHFAWDGDNGVETTLVRPADCRMTETHDWDLGEFADAIPLAPQPVEAQPAETEWSETEADEPAETPAENKGRRRRRRSGAPKRHLAGANWLAYMPSSNKPSAGKPSAGKPNSGKEAAKAPQQADAER